MIQQQAQRYTDEPKASGEMGRKRKWSVFPSSVPGLRATVEALSSCRSVFPSRVSVSNTPVNKVFGFWLHLLHKFQPALQTAPLSVPSQTSSDCFSLNVFN